MSLLDTVKDIFNKGPDDWYGRLKPNLLLTSPKGTMYKAKYIEDQMRVEKNVGLYDLPKAKGTIAHDLGNKSFMSSFPVFFDGKDCDKKGIALMRSLKESGPWGVDHPLYGFFKLQPLRAEMRTAPVAEGNVIAVNIEWLEPIDEKTGKTGRELAGIVDELSTDVNNGMFTKFTNALKTGTEAYDNATRRAVQGIQNLADFALAPIVAPIDAANSLFNTTQNALNDIRLATVFQVEQVVGMLQDLIQIPIAATNKRKNRKEAYDNFTNSVLAQKSTTRSSYERNDVLVTELALAAALVAQAQVAITTPIRSINETSGQNEIGLTSRTDIIDSIESLVIQYNTIVDSLDVTQTLYAPLYIENQYQAFSEVYGSLAQLVYYTVAYLSKVSYDLALEKIIYLDMPRSPIDVVISEYGSLGYNDYYLDLFIESNQLTGEELMLLPATKSVKIYA